MTHICYRTMMVVLVSFLQMLSVGYAQSVDNYATVTYGQNPIYQADIFFKVLAIKGRQFLDISNISQPEIKFYDQTVYPENGDQQLKVEITGVEFAEDNHARRYKMQIKQMNTQDFFLVSGYQENFVLQDKNKFNDNTTAAFLFEIPGNGPRTVSFSCTVLDENNQVIGQGNFSKRFSILSPPKPEPVSQPQVQTTETKQLTEDEFWQSIASSNDIEDFELYNLRFPNGKYQAQANEKILTIREDKAWARTLRVNTLNEYKSFIARYPNSNYKRDAQQKIASLSPKTPPPSSDSDPVNAEDTHWNGVVEANMISGYKDYLLNYPDGKYQEQALRNIPLEILPKRSMIDDLSYSVEVWYATPTLKISLIEIPEDTLTYQSSTTPIPSNISLPYEYIYWEEGNATVLIEAQESYLTRFNVTLGKRKKYNIQFVDEMESRTISLEADIPPLSIQSVDNLNNPSDSLIFEIDGGVPSYFIRLVTAGNNVTQGEIEQELSQDPVTGKYVVSRSAITEGLPNGTYMLYVLDSRKTDYQPWEDELLEVGEGKMNIKIWQIMLPVLLIIIILIVIINKRSKKSSGYGRA